MNEEVEDLIALNPRFDYGREKKSNLCLCYTPLMIVFYICISNVLINEIYYNHFMYVDVLFPLVGVQLCEFCIYTPYERKEKGSSNSKIDFSTVAAT